MILFLALLFSCEGQPAQINVYYPEESLDDGRGFSSGFEALVYTAHVEALRFEQEPDSTIEDVTPNLYLDGEFLGVLQSVTVVEFLQEDNETYDPGCKFEVDPIMGGTGDLFLN